MEARPVLIPSIHLSRVASVTSPESGTMSFSYAFSGGALCSGNPSAVCVRTDARGISITYVYDVLNRLKIKDYRDAPLIADYFYYDESTSTNPKGRLTSYGTYRSSSGLVTSSVLSYDPMGRPSYQWECMPPNCLTYQFNVLSYAYDLIGDRTSFTDGVGHTFTQIV